MAIGECNYLYQWLSSCHFISNVLHKLQEIMAAFYLFTLRILIIKLRTH